MLDLTLDIIDSKKGLPYWETLFLDGFNIKFSKTPNTIASDVPEKLSENRKTPLMPLVKMTDIIIKLRLSAKST